MKRSEAKKKSIRRNLTALVIMVSLYLSFAPGTAWTETTEDENGVYLGFALMGTSFHTDFNSPAFNIKEEGGGAKVSIGYRFNPDFMLEIVGGGSKYETSDSTINSEISSIQLFGYYRFLPGKTFRPYVKGGLAGYSLKLEYGSASARLNGGGIAFGGGFRCFLSPRFSLGIDFTHNMIRYDKAEFSLGAFSYESSADEYGRLTTLGITAGYSF